MDFFEAQAAAQRTSRRLLLLFLVGLSITVVVTVYVAAWFTALMTPPILGLTSANIEYAFSGEILFYVTMVVSAVIGGAIWLRIGDLSDGGRTVAEGLSGRLIPPNSRKPAERRCLNVVEELSIAAGMPVPPVYVIESPGINAFAAGFGTGDAVVGVTRGALRGLSRDELQGIIGHELSHILNGDMRLNIRLIALVYGLQAIGFWGAIFTTQTDFEGKRTISPILLPIGVALTVVGFVGTLFGTLMKAAVSRQREYLADASSVQFTRNSQGIVDALRRVGGASGTGSTVPGNAAEEMSHMFFCNAVDGLLARVFATHPSLESRIRAISPGWNGMWLRTPPPDPEVDGDPAGSEGGLGDAIVEAIPYVIAAAATPAAAAIQPGHVTPQDVRVARNVLDRVPRAWYDAMHDPFGARAGIYALLLEPPRPPPGSESATLLARQLAYLEAHAEPGVPELIDRLHSQRVALQEGARLPLIHASMPALKSLSQEQYERFRANVVKLIRSDAGISRFEWVVHQVLNHELRAHFEGGADAGDQDRSLKDEARASAILLSSLARIGHSGDEAREAFAQGAAIVELAPDAFIPEKDENLQQLTRSVARLRRLQPLAQPKLIKAAFAVVEHDGVIQAEERDLLHGVASALSFPLPPFPPKQVSH